MTDGLMIENGSDPANHRAAINEIVPEGFGVVSIAFEICETCEGLVQGLPGSW